MSTPQFRFIGTTTDATTCEQCGRVDLAKTVILGVLDADGNTAEVTYYGSTCAAKALAARYGVKMTRAKVLDAAEAAERQRRAEDEEARRLLGYYGLPLTGEADQHALDTAAGLYAHQHRHAAWAWNADWTAKVLDMMARRQALVIH